MEESQVPFVDTASPAVVPPSPTPADNLELATPVPPTFRRCPWGPWATIGWTLLCVIVLFGAQIVAAIIFLVIRAAATGSTKFDDLGINGNLLAFATLCSTLGTVGLVVPLILVRRCSIREYLALNWPPARSVLHAFGGLTIVLVATDVSSYVLGKPLVPSFMADVYHSSWLPALAFALVVLAPVGEETVFRGFLYEGLAASRGGPLLAVVISSLGFTLLHGFQYDLHALAGVAAMGFFLGFIRYRFGSLALTMVLHAVANAIATFELIVQEQWLK